MIALLCGGEGLPTVNLAHVDLTRGEQRPEQHCRRIGRRQHGLLINPPLELFVQTLDRVRCSCASPLARRQARESEEVAASFFEAIGNRSTLWSRHLRMKAVRRVSISSGVAA